MQHKLLSRSVPFYGSVFLALGILFAAGPAQAGFQWLSPSEEVGPSGGAAPSTMAPVSQPFPAPQIIEGTPRQAIQMIPAVEPAPKQWQDTMRSVPEPAKDEAVRGFADNVPLSVALRQVLPQDVGFSVAQDVSLGTLVSWKGGASWRDVMKSMLRPVGLTIKEKGAIVQVVRDSGAQAPLAPASSALPPVPTSASSSPSLQPLVAQPLEAERPMALLPPASSVASAPSRGMPLVPAPVPTRSIPDRPGDAPGFLVPPSGSTSALPVSMPAPHVMDKTIDAWTANKGETLQKVLEGWAHRANIELSWQAEYDYPLQASASLTGTFEEAVRELLAGFQGAKPQPIGFLYNNQAAGQTVLVVQTRGNNYNE